jgi:hypothetical protein
MDWRALSELYRVAPLGDKKPDHLKRCFSNSMFKCFVIDGGRLVGADQERAVKGGLVEDELA